MVWVVLTTTRKIPRSIHVFVSLTRLPLSAWCGMVFQTLGFHTEGWKELQKNPNFLLKVIRWGVNMLHAAKG